MSRRTSNFQNPRDEIQIDRYYNDAVIALKIIYESAAEGSHGAREALHAGAEYLSRLAFNWSRDGSGAEKGGL